MNQPPKGIQDLIYSLEEGAGKAFTSQALLLLLALFVGVVYHLSEFRNFSTAESMDGAQIARNMSRGEGYTTQFIRPLSLHLLQAKEKEHQKDPNAVLKRPHPDLANAPLYPTFLSVAMRVLPFEFTIPDTRTEADFTRYQPDVMISYLNLGLLLILSLLMFAVSKRLFDSSVAALATAVLIGSEIIWKFTYSGLSTNLLWILFLLLVWTLIRLEPTDPTVNEEGEEIPAPSPKAGWIEAGLIGLLLGLLGLTRYGMLVLIPPVIALVVFGVGIRRWAQGALALAVALVVVCPWLIRNQSLSGYFFGTAGFAPYQDAGYFSEYRLERSQSPDFAKVEPSDIRRKLTLNITQIFTEEIPRMGGSYVTALFVVGLLLPFSAARRQRIRWWVVACLIALSIAQALGKTHLSTASPIINSENLIVLLLPLITLFGVALFFVLLDRVEFLVPQVRKLAIGAFVVVVSLPLLLLLLPPRTYPLAYPPYHPLIIQSLGNFLRKGDPGKPGELMMSDMPWGMAWYGDRDCIWTSLKVKDNYQEDFFQIHDFQRTINGVYLSPITADAPWRSKFLNLDDPDTAWNRFYMDSLLRTNMPGGFPLKHALGSYMASGHFFLSDAPRWGSYSTLRPNR